MADTNLDAKQQPSRLGKKELGPHAFETRMPARVQRLIDAETGPAAQPGTIPALAALLRRDPSVDRAYLCRADVPHIAKIPGEGNHFCGYRNLQMLLLSTSAAPPAVRAFYGVPALQGMIEDAWDQGFNAHARGETGGIRGTRKHIGTSEAQALMQSLGVPCAAMAFHPESRGAHHALLDAMESYFSKGVVGEDRICLTNKPPVFLQRPDHSLTVVGLERGPSGTRRLLVFDPAFRPARLLDPARRVNSRRQSRLRLWERAMLPLYRRGEGYLRRYDRFEILCLD